MSIVSLLSFFVHLVFSFRSLMHYHTGVISGLQTCFGGKELKSLLLPVMGGDEEANYSENISCCVR